MRNNSDKRLADINTYMYIHTHIHTHTGIILARKDTSINEWGSCKPTLYSPIFLFYKERIFIASISTYASSYCISTIGNHIILKE